MRKKLVAWRTNQKNKTKSERKQNKTSRKRKKNTQNDVYDEKSKNKQHTYSYPHSTRYTLFTWAITLWNLNLFESFFLVSSFLSIFFRWFTLHFFCVNKKHRRKTVCTNEWLLCSIKKYIHYSVPKNKTKMVCFSLPPDFRNRRKKNIQNR